MGVIANIAWLRRATAAAGRVLIRAGAVLGELGLILTRAAVGPFGVARVDDLRLYPRDRDRFDVCPMSRPENRGDQPAAPDGFPTWIFPEDRPKGRGE